MKFKLKYTISSDLQLSGLENSPDKAAECKAVKKALGLMETNLSHKSLCTHKYDSLSGPNGEEVFEAYAENNTPGAYRIFWYYGPSRGMITILAITPHPD
jgi:hypothetical protein